jgi:hypothetical protein
MMRRIAIAFAALSACTAPEAPAGPNGAANGSAPGPSSGQAGGEQPGAAAPALQRSLKPSLQWKRYATFESDLAAALELAPDQLCNEFGKEPCIRGVHLGPLGGHDIRTGLLESPPEPLITTPTVVERVVLSACVARAELERTAGAKVFAGVNLAGDAPAPESEPTRALVSSLVRRFFARDPSDDELEVLGSLARDERGAPRTGPTFATAVCLALGLSSEFLFF